MDRLNQLIQFAFEEPDDPFNQYALALEYLKTDPGKAVSLFDQLTQTHPDYLPTYYPFAQLLIEQKDSKKAEQAFLAGIDMAIKVGDMKTLKELKGAYGDWMYERE